MRKWFHLLALMPLLTMAESYLPPERPLPDLSDLTRADEIVAKSPVLGEFLPGKLRSSIPLNGTWRLSPLETAEQPFGPADSRELNCAAPEFDDSAWNSIRVPLNWYLLPQNEYGKIYRSGEMLNPVSAGGNLVHGIINSYAKGWYRRELVLDAIPAGTRAVISFERIGYQAELFVNGKPAADCHHGDFVVFESDITDLLTPGKNVLALRVCADIRPINGRFPHTYGAMWGMNSYKGGIWGRVKLDFVAAPRVESVKLIAPASGKLELHASVINSGIKPLTVVPGISVIEARKGAAANGREYPALELKPGRNELSFPFQEPTPHLWSFREPNLYFATLFFRNSDRILSADTTRFGFRDFEIRGKKFYLNGEETYLFFESAHSIHFGGFDTSDGHAIRPAERIGGYKKLGYNMIRTAHMPVPQEVLDCADEFGMMVYDEWSMCFVTGIAKEVFEQNNLSELAKFVAADHNHPSVVMWSLGNEVSHKLDPELPAQLDKQYDLVRELDLQKRPICSFAGMADTECYGKAKLKTDVLDLHCYIGMTDSWTLTNRVSDSYQRQLAAIYGDGKEFPQPYIISESVGGGWGYSLDPNYHSNVPEYLEIMKRPFHWGEPGSTGYSGAIGVAAATDPNRAGLYFQNRMGRRILELFRLDPNYSGISPWFAEHTMKSARVWNQEYYPGLRLPGSFAPRQLLAGTTVKLENFLINSGNRTLSAPELRVSLELNGKEYEIDRMRFAISRPGSRLFVRREVTMPMLSDGRGELKLTLFEGDQEVGRNSYDITFHTMPEPLTDSLPVAVLSRDPALNSWLKKLNINATFLASPESLSRFSRAVVAGKESLPRNVQKALRNWVKEGGFLLALECESGFVPGFSEYRSIVVGAPLVELVAINHPLFAGLHQDDFDLWTECGNGYVTETAVIPLDKTMLAANGIYTHNRKAGAVVVEAGFGKGRVLVSTFNARRIADRNGAAAKWLGNLLRYFASAGTKLATPEALVPQERITEFDVDPACVRFVDLRPCANRAFRDEQEGDGKGGWTDQGGNDYRNFPSGKQTGAGVPFDLIDPAANGGNGCLMLRGAGFPGGPATVKNITVNAKARTLYFLHTAAYVSGTAPVAYYVIHYADDTTAKVPLIPGRNIADWWNQSLPDFAFPAFARPNKATSSVSFFVAAWDNPTPEKEIKSFDFVSADNGAVVALAAVTFLPALDATSLLPLEGGGNPWICGRDGAGKPATARMVSGKNPVGRTAMQVCFPATGNSGFPFAIAPVQLGGMAGRTPSYLSILFRSRSESVVDIQVPDKNWRGHLSLPLDLALSRGEWVRIRFDLKKNVRQTGVAFPLAEPRSEIGFFNGKEREFGYPRNEATFEVADLRYEFDSQTK